MENLDEQFVLLDQLMEPATMEQELELEKKILWFTEGATKEQLINTVKQLKEVTFINHNLLLIV
jgi:hypothetical protein